VSRAIRIAAGVIVAAAAVGLVLVLPHWLSDARAAEFARAGCFFIAILGLNLLTGYTGQISLGHGALMAVGGYTTAILTADHGFRDLWTIPLAGVVAMAAGFVLGLPAVRLSGLYLALATFAVAIAMPALLKKFSGLTGGSRGITHFDTALTRSTGALGPVHVFGRAVATNDFL
jgi:branched-chain amino acid transport system permease protein